jgi:GDPmannose 4,6-dehydratase
VSRRAIITGVTGQDGSYLAELLLSKGYEVVGAVRRASAPNFWRIQHLLDRITLKPADLLDQLSIIRLVDEVRPHEFYNLAAMSFVPASWDQPMLTGEFNAQGVTRVLEAIRHVDPSIRLYQASSSEMFGKVRQVPQNELTPFYPRSPYGVSKVFAHYITVNYRESYDLFAVSGMLFNHESPRRGLEFVTRKVTEGVARIKLGRADTLSLGNLDASRDWGFAGDYVNAMWLMLQQDRPDDYVIASGISHSVRDLVQVAFGHVGLEWQKSIKTDPTLIRPAEVEHLIGDSSKARSELGWGPSVDFPGLITMMVDADLERVAAAPHSADRLSTL